MSKLEESIKSRLQQQGIKHTAQVPVPLSDYPWKSKNSRSNPRSDIYLPDFDLYIEVKGFMTMEAMSKMAFLTRQNFRYYIFQGTEFEWNPWIQSGIKTTRSTGLSKTKQLKENFEHQIQELLTLKKGTFLNNMSAITLVRLQDFITTKIRQYEAWNGEWY